MDLLKKMPNPNKVQFSATTPSISALRYVNFYLGVQDQDYGPTSKTGFWNGISVPNGGYVIYFDKATQGPSIYVANNDSDALSVLKQFYGNIVPLNQQGSLSSMISALYGGGDRTDSIILNKNYENIITNNLFICFDPSVYMCQVQTTGNPSLIKNISNKLIDAQTNNMFSNGSSVSVENGLILQFDGVDDRIFSFDFNLYTDLRFTGDVTYEFFIKIKDLTGGTPSPLYFKSPIGEGSLSANTSNKLVYSYGNGTTAQTFESTNALTNNTWYHIVMVRDLSNTSKLYFYLNGVEDSNTSATYSTAAVTSDSTVFFQNGLVGTRYTFADLGVLRLYKSALTAAQVLQNFNAQKSRFGL